MNTPNKCAGEVGAGLGDPVQVLTAKERIAPDQLSVRPCSMALYRMGKAGHPNGAALYAKLSSGFSLTGKQSVTILNRTFKQVRKQLGLDVASAKVPALLGGNHVHRGALTFATVAEAHGLPFESV